MQRQVRWIVVMVCVMCSPAMAASPYLFDVIKKPAYARALRTLFDHSGDLPKWTREILAKDSAYKSGISTPAAINGTTYEVFFVCTEEFSCNDTAFSVMFTPNGTQAWGALLQEGTLSYLGSPSDAQQAVLKKAVHGDN